MKNILCQLYMGQVISYMRVVELTEMHGATRFSDRLCELRPKGTSNKLNITDKGEGVSVNVYWNESGQQTHTHAMTALKALTADTKDGMDTIHPIPI